MPAAIEVPFRPKPRLTFKKSEAVSPTVVHKTFMIQKNTVTCGTLLNVPFGTFLVEFESANGTEGALLSVILLFIPSLAFLPVVMLTQVANYWVAPHPRQVKPLSV
jgi:hypothetical protein